MGSFAWWWQPPMIAPKIISTGDKNFFFFSFLFSFFRLLPNRFSWAKKSATSVFFLYLATSYDYLTWESIEGSLFKEFIWKTWNLWNLSWNPCRRFASLLACLSLDHFCHCSAATWSSATDGGGGAGSGGQGEGGEEGSQLYQQCSMVREGFTQKMRKKLHSWSNYSVCSEETLKGKKRGVVICVSLIPSYDYSLSSNPLNLLMSQKM